MLPVLVRQIGSFFLLLKDVIVFVTKLGILLCLFLCLVLQDSYMGEEFRSQTESMLSQESTYPLENGYTGRAAGDFAPAYRPF